DLPVNVKPYRELANTFGSDTRDKALILETLVLVNDRTKAFELLKEVAASLGDQGSWMSTQETAMCLRSVARFAGGERHGEMEFDYRLGNGKTVRVSTSLPLAQVRIPEGKAQALDVINKTDGVLFTRLIQTGIPSRDEESTVSKNL